MSQPDQVTTRRRWTRAPPRCPVTVRPFCSRVPLSRPCDREVPHPLRRDRSADLNARHVREVVQPHTRVRKRPVAAAQAPARDPHLAVEVLKRQRNRRRHAAHQRTVRREAGARDSATPVAVAAPAVRPRPRSSPGPLRPSGTRSSPAARSPSDPCSPPSVQRPGLSAVARRCIRRRSSGPVRRGCAGHHRLRRAASASPRCRVGGGRRRWRRRPVLADRKTRHRRNRGRRKRRRRAGRQRGKEALEAAARPAGAEAEDHGSSVSAQ